MSADHTRLLQWASQTARARRRRTVRLALFAALVLVSLALAWLVWRGAVST